MKCESCKSNTTMQVHAIVSAPGELYHSLSKINIRKKEIQIMGVLWETTDFICNNSNCQKVTNGYGNYVTNLKKENEDLKEKIKKLENSILDIVLNTDAKLRP